MHKYITFSLGNLRFIDSFAFLLTSLDSLVKATPKDSFKITKKLAQRLPVNLLLRKAVYPYEYMDSQEKFEETQLPSKESFFSKLTGENISDEDYMHAQKV